MKSKVLSLFFILYIPVATFSQDVIMSGEALYMSTFSLTNGTIMGAAIKAKKKKGNSTGVVKKSTLRDLNFNRSEALSKAIQQDFITRLSKEQPGSKDKLEKAFAGNRLRSEFDHLLTGYGYSGTNLADAMTAYLVINWQIVNGQEYNDRRGFDAVRKTIMENLLNSSALSNASNKNKQTAAEIFGYQSIIAMNTYKTLKAKGDKAGLERFKNDIDKSVKQSGMDLKTLRLTSNGFVKL